MNDDSLNEHSFLNDYSFLDTCFKNTIDTDITVNEI